MTIVVTPSGNILQLDDHLDRLKTLVADIEQLKSGRHPDLNFIKGSVYAREWVLDTRPVPCLRGYFEGHPHVRSGRMGVTSDLWIWAPDQGYARSLTRYYALGRQGLDGREPQ